MHMQNVCDVGTGFANGVCLQYVCKSVEVQNFAHPHTCEMCAMHVQVFQLEFVCKQL